MMGLPWLARGMAIGLLGLLGVDRLEAGPQEAGPFQATGFKVGEVTDRSVIVWTRLTRNPHPNRSDAPMVEIERVAADAATGSGPLERAVFPDGVTVDDLRNAVPGAAGEVLVEYRPAGGSRWQSTGWQPVNCERDSTRQLLLERLAPATEYELRVRGRSPDGTEGQTLDGRFATAPASDQAAAVRFTVSTGQAFPDQDAEGGGYRIYASMRTLEPDFFVHTGDILYYDRLAKNRELALYHWQRMYSLPTNVDFHRHVPSYFIKDDHDTWRNDCWPTQQSGLMGDFTFQQGVDIFRFQVPMGERTYRSVRWGRDLQIWLVEGRDFRSPNPQDDGPDKTIWGAEQKEWFFRTVAASDATFRILISPTPLVGPDRDNKNDNHANRGFTHEGNQLREFIASQPNLFVVCGDRHWQYHSIDPVTGVREYSCGPASDRHAGGWRQDDFREDYHRYLQVIGGFLSVTVERLDDRPIVAFRFHDVEGEVQFEDRHSAD